MTRDNYKLQMIRVLIDFVSKSYVYCVFYYIYTKKNIQVNFHYSEKLTLWNVVIEGYIS